MVLFDYVDVSLLDFLSVIQVCVRLYSVNCKKHPSYKDVMSGVLRLCEGVWIMVNAK